MITLDSTDHGTGTNLAYVQEGPSISPQSWPNGSPYGAPGEPTRTDVFATSCVDNYYACLSPEGLGLGGAYMVGEYAVAFGSSTCGATSAGEFTFSDLPSDVSLASDTPTMRAYDIPGDLIDMCNSDGGASGTTFPANDPYTPAGILAMNGTQRDIYRMVAGGLTRASLADRISYSVPERGTPSVPQPSAPSVPQPSAPQLSTPSFVPQPGTPSVPQPSTPSVPEPSTPSMPQPSTPFVPEPGTPYVPEPGPVSVPEPGSLGLFGLGLAGLLIRRRRVI